MHHSAGEEIAPTIDSSDEVRTVSSMINGTAYSRLRAVRKVGACNARRAGNCPISVAARNK